MRWAPRLAFGTMAVLLGQRPATRPGLLQPELRASSFLPRRTLHVVSSWSKLCCNAAFGLRWKSTAGVLRLLDAQWHPQADWPRFTIAKLKVPVLQTACCPVQSASVCQAPLVTHPVSWSTDFDSQVTCLDHRRFVPRPRWLLHMRWAPRLAFGTMAVLLGQRPATRPGLLQPELRASSFLPRRTLHVVSSWSKLCCNAAFSLRWKSTAGVVGLLDVQWHPQADWPRAAMTHAASPVLSYPIRPHVQSPSLDASSCHKGRCQSCASLGSRW